MAEPEVTRGNRQRGTWPPASGYTNKDFGRLLDELRRYCREDMDQFDLFQIPVGTGTAFISIMLELGPNERADWYRPVNGLDGVERVEWASLKHAFGPASDLPALFRDVASSDIERRETAIDTLFNTVWHQGTVYEASAEAAGFIAMLAMFAEIRPVDRGLLVSLLSCIASGTSFLATHGDLAGSPFDMATLPIELGWVERARSAVDRFAPRVIDLLSGDDVRLDWRLAELASQACIADDARLREVLGRLAAGTDDARLLAALDLTAALTADTVDEGLIDRCSAVPHETSVTGQPNATLDERARLLAADLFKDGFETTHAAW